MHKSSKLLQIVLSVLALVVVSVVPAHAKCTRLAFSVNDYGKIEPARDAKRLLDKYIADWMGERGITNYRTGPKSVKCELFLDFIVFDEYTCRAEATACWGGSTPEGGAVSNSGGSGSAASDPAPAVSPPAVSPPAASPPAASSGSHNADGRYVSSP